MLFTGQRAELLFGESEVLIAARHLVDLGHRRFAILAMEFAEDGHTGPATAERVAAATYTPSRDRVSGYFDELAVAGIDTAQVPIFETTHVSPYHQSSAPATMLR